MSVAATRKHRIWAGVQIILSEAEHHGNLVPWQMLAQRTGAVLRHVGLTSTQEVDIEVLHSTPLDSLTA